MKRTLMTSTFTLMVAALLVLPAIASAQPAPRAPGFRGPHGPGPGGDGEFMLERMAEHLDLSESQITEIEALIENHKIATAELRVRAELEREVVQELMESDVFDEAAIRAAAEEGSQTRIDLMVERARLKSAIDGVLTPEQKEKAAEWRAQREERREFFEERRGERRGDRPSRAPRVRRW